MIEPHQLVPVYLEDPESATLQTIGTKAFTLSRLLRDGFEIPPFFSFPALGVREAINFSPEHLDTEALFRSLSHLRSNGADLFIVRSSAVEEDKAGNLFPGIFHSIRDLRTDEAVIDAICTCFHSVDSERVNTYCRLRGFPLDELRLAVFVQSQISPRFSGILFTESPLATDVPTHTMLVEVTTGPLADLVLGRTSGWSYTLTPTDKDLAVKPLVEAPNNLHEQLAPTLKDLFPQAVRIAQVLGGAQDIEWCCDGVRIWILQARPISTRQKATRDLQRQARSRTLKKLLPGEDFIGLKGAAMIEFAKRQWFRKPVLFLQPDGDLEEFSKHLDRCDFGGSWITVRYSHGNDIGLPRRFVKTKREVLDTLRETRNQEWLGIVHGYIDVQRSFELYVAKDSLVLEHVPGIWESDNKSPPDLVQIQREKTTIFRVTENRTAKYVDPDGSRLLIQPPLPKSVLERWTHSIKPYGEGLTALCSDGLPIICHFVEDGDGQWNFLNLRRSSPLERNQGKPGFLFPVSSLRDLEHWDGHRPILLQLSVDRGYENLLRELALELPREPGMVYLDVGILSHPAIALREFGVSPMPIYLSHEQFELMERLHEY